jgi:beta-mannanase
MIPWLSWSSVKAGHPHDRSYSDRAIANGSHDGYITSWAKAAAAWGHPLFLRFDWEMNGRWHPWSVGENGNTPASYVAMWKHVHKLFVRAGATNVTWVWCPNVGENGSLASIPSLYPGDAYVDWTCLDAYNGDDPWMTLSSLISPTYLRITGVAPAKPMIIGETSSTNAGGSKASWIASMFGSLASYPAIRGLLWYDVKSLGPGGHRDWPIETSASSEQAFKNGISSEKFTTNSFSRLTVSPILPPVG